MRSRSNRISPASIRISQRGESATRNGQQSTRSSSSNNQLLMNNIGSNTVAIGNGISQNNYTQQFLQISNGQINNQNNGVNGLQSPNTQQIKDEPKSHQNSHSSTPQKNESYLGNKKLISGTVPINYNQQVLNNTMNSNKNSQIQHQANIQNQNQNNGNQNSNFQFGNTQAIEGIKGKNVSFSNKLTSISNSNINGQNSGQISNHGLKSINSRPSTGRGQPKKDLQIQLGFENIDLIQQNTTTNNQQSYDATSEGTNAVLSAKSSNYTNIVTPSMNGLNNPNVNVVNNYLNNRLINKPFNNMHRRMTPNRLNRIEKINLPTPSQYSSRNTSPYQNNLQNNSARNRKQQQINKSYNGNKENNSFLEGSSIHLSTNTGIQQQQSNVTPHLINSVQPHLISGISPNGQIHIPRFNNKSPISSARANSHNNNSNQQISHNQNNNLIQFERSNNSPLISKLSIISNSTRSSSSNNNNRNKSGRSIIKSRQIGNSNNNSFIAEENSKINSDYQKNGTEILSTTNNSIINNGQNIKYFSNQTYLRQNQIKNNLKDKINDHDDKLNNSSIPSQTPKNQVGKGGLSPIQQSNSPKNEFQQKFQNQQKENEQQIENNQKNGSEGKKQTENDQNQQNNKVITNMKYSFRTRKGFMPNNPNKVNQDAYIIHQNINKKQWQHFYSICDGHGVFGHDVSGYLKRIFPLLFNEQSDRLETDTRKVLNEIYEEANEMLNYDSNIDLLFSGTTVNSVYFHKNSLFCANIGDSRAILGKKNSQEKWSVIPLSRDHKPNDQEEAQRVIAENGRIESFRDAEGKPIGPARVWLKNENVPGLAMTRSMGDAVAESVGVTWRPEIIEYELSHNDKILVIASDGVWEFIDNKEIIKMIAPFYQRNDIEGACECLLQESHLRWTKECNVIDDISFIIIFMNM